MCTCTKCLCFWCGPMWLCMPMCMGACNGCYGLHWWGEWTLYGVPDYIGKCPHLASLLNLVPYAWKCSRYEIFANCQLNKIFAFLFSRMLAPFPSELPGRLPCVLLLSCCCHYRRLVWRSAQLFLTCPSESTVRTKDVHRWEMFAKQVFASVTSFAKFTKISYREHFHAYGTFSAC